MNNVFTFVAVVVAIVMFAEIIKTWMKQKQKDPETDAELEETLAKIDVLEERIKVLERIITENRFDLKDEIDSL